MNIYIKTLRALGFIAILLASMYLILRYYFPEPQLIINKNIIEHKINCDSLSVIGPIKVTDSIIHNKGSVWQSSDMDSITTMQFAKMFGLKTKIGKNGQWIVAVQEYDTIRKIEMWIYIPH